MVRTFGSEERESGRYISQLGALRRISVRQGAAYLLYLASNASLFHLTKVPALPHSRDAGRIALGAVPRHALCVQPIWAGCQHERRGSGLQADTCSC